MQRCVPGDLKLDNVLLSDTNLEAATVRRMRA
jgi:hypothetical protein